MTRSTSPILRVEWVKKGPENFPTVIAFTGFGHRLDPWRRLNLPGWRVAVVEFPVGRSPNEPWTLEALVPQIDALWREAPLRALLSFSFGGAGATAVASQLAAHPELYAQPDFAAYVAPVQWSRIPWSAIRAVPASRRLWTLKHLTRSGSALIGPVAARLGNPAVRQFADLVERHVGWDFVSFYLPYIDWIGSSKKTLKLWQKHPWPTMLVGAQGDTVIPSAGMEAQVTKYAPRVIFKEVHASHFNALDLARSELLPALELLSSGDG